MNGQELIKRIGLTAEYVRDFSAQKGEPVWMKDMRLAAFDWLAHDASIQAVSGDAIDYSMLSLESLQLYTPSSASKINCYQACAESSSGKAVQHDSDMICAAIGESLRERGVIFASMDDALIRYPDLVKTYFGTIVAHTSNIWAALNSVLWSGGLFIYVPEGVVIDEPLSAHFFIHQHRMGQFERTLCIVESHARALYHEGCSVSVDQSYALHAAVVEVIVRDHAYFRYTTLQRWGSDMATLVTKRARLDAHASIDWIDANFGSGLLVKYPTVELAGIGARARMVSFARICGSQKYDIGSGVVHSASETHSSMVSRVIACDNASVMVRSRIRMLPHLTGAQAYSTCDTLIESVNACSSAKPALRGSGQTNILSHEARVRSYDDTILLYCMSRGFSLFDARYYISRGFAHDFLSLLPPDIALECEGLLS